MKIVLEHTRNFSARLIQLWMWVDAIVHLEKPTFTYNHALIEHEGIMYEAIDEGVVCWSKAEHYKQKKHKKGYKAYTVELDLTEDQVQLALHYLIDQLEKDYEFSNFLFHPIKTFFGWLGSKSDKKQYCYELVIRTLNATGKYKIDLFLNPREFKKLF